MVRHSGKVKTPFVVTKEIKVFEEINLSLANFLQKIFRELIKETQGL